MRTSIPLSDIQDQLIRQLSSFFKLQDSEIQVIKTKWEEVMSRCEYSFSKNSNKYYSLEGEPYFNPYQSAQYTIFLYYFSNTVSRETDCRLLADKLYYLNKIISVR